MNLILLAPNEVNERSHVRLSDERAKHLLEILNVHVGQTVRLGIVDGPMGEGCVTQVDGETVELSCTFGQEPLRPRVDLLLALPRPKVLKRLWAQLAALGVGRIILTNAEKVERNYYDTHVLDETFYRKLLMEGLQQARDTHLPRVSIHKQFRKLIESELPALSDAGIRLVAHPGAAPAISDILSNADGKRVLLAVGPEGGWNDFELSLLDAAGFTRIALGSRTLRTDTACISLLALVHDALGN